MRGAVDLAAWLGFATEHRESAHVVTAGNRPGAASFYALLESRHFSGAMAVHYSCVALVWQGRQWVIGSFPQSYLKEAQELARSLALRLVTGCPSVESAGVTLRFPGHNRWTRTVENNLRNPIYEDIARSQAAIIQRELDVCGYLGRGHLLMPTQVLEYIYHDGQLPEIGQTSASEH